MKQKKIFVVYRFVIATISFFILVIAILLLSHAVSATTLSKCGNITSSGVYILNQSITSAGTCLTVWVSNVEINCNGSNISYNTLGSATLIGIDAINSTIAETNLTVKNCLIKKPSNAGTSGYGVRFTRFSNSRLVNNTIYTNGTTNNYGIYLTTNSQNNTIENNTIYAKGSSTGNTGIYLLTGCSNNTLNNNDIFTNGTTTGYGIWISGVTTESSNNTIIYNTIRTFGTGASNYGIYLMNNSNSNIVSGNDIITNGTTTNYGIYFTGAAGLPVNYNTIDSNTIQTKGTTTNNYGVYLLTNADFNNVTDNFVNTSGSTGNSGVVISGVTSVSSGNFVFGNVIRTFGTTNNYGVYLLTNVSSNNVSGNDIITNGTNTNHGIYLSGTAVATPVNSNEVSDNSIQIFGTTAGTTSGYGVYLQNAAVSNDILNNTISTNGNTSNWGVYLFGTAVFSPSYNVIDSNVINTVGSGTNNYGVYLLTNADFNNVTDNFVNTSGSTGNSGVVISGVTSVSSGNFVFGNVIRTFGTTNNYGVYLLTNVSSNNVSGNDIITNGTNTNHGIYLVGLAAAPVSNNEVSDNTVQTKCSTASSTCHGIYIQNLAANNSILGNTITTGGTTNNYGIYLFGTAALLVNLTMVSSNTLNVSKADRINIASGVLNTTIKNNVIINRDYSYYDIHISASGVNRTSFVDQYFENYTFTGVGGLISVRNSNFAEIVFLASVNGSGTNFSKDVNMSNNYIYVNSSKVGLNKSARLTLYGLTFVNPMILRDNSSCSDCVILNYTAGNLIFNVSHFSSYSAAENYTVPPVIESIIINDSIFPDNETILSAGTTQTVRCDIRVSDPLGVDNIFGANATFYYYQNLSSNNDDNLVHYTDTSCALSQSNPTNKMFSCTFDVWYYANNGTWNCNATAYNNESISASANTTTLIDPLYAVNITDGIDFGNSPANTSSANISVNITNFGNMPVNITLQGYALVIGDNLGMNCSDGTNITITNIRFSSNSTSDFSQKTPMNGSIQELNLQIKKQTGASPVYNSTFWQIAPDPGTAGRYCMGYVIFNAQAP